MDDEFINLFSSCTRRLSSRGHRISNRFTKRTCVPRRLVYASVTNKLSYIIKCLLPVVFVQLRKQAWSLVIVCTFFPFLQPLRVEAMLLVAQMIKNLPAVWETWVRSLDWEDPLEKRMATHSIIRAWRIPPSEEPGGL